MKWFLGFTLVVALIAGALFSVGYFLLPNELAVTRSVAIERPRATVFAMINDLRIVREWSPFYARDPEAEYAFSGEGPGEGQTMRWTSQIRDVGAGRVSIVESTANESVTTIIEISDKATLNGLLEVSRRSDGGATLAWTVTAACSRGAINVPCRYMNLVLRGAIERDLDQGLARLKTLAEQLPDVDFEGLQAEVEDVAPTAYVYSPVSTSNRDASQVEAALNTGIGQVQSFMSLNQLVRAGPQMRVTTEWDPAEARMSFRVGYPFSGPMPLTVVGVQIGQTPSGRALRVRHEGPRSQIPATYARAYAFLQAHRIALREGGLPWEVVISDGAENQPAQVEIFIPLT